jgi:thiamine biosynthesis lipoprotein
VVDAFFRAVFTRSVEINEITDGAFDPSVMPLVSAWGFGPAEVPQIDTTLIDSLRSLVGLSRFGIYFSLWKNAQNIKLDTSYLIKTINEIQLDFNGIAQGYSVDVLAAYLENKTVTNYLIEVGGEIKAKGANPSGERWLIGIDKPEDHLRERPLQATVALMDNAIATSGSYRKFYELNGTKYSHTIDPFTGYPVTHSLLSATVMTQECMSADAYATAFMVMGLNSSRRFLEQHEELALEAYFIYADENGKHLTYTTPGLEMLLNEDL